MCPASLTLVELNEFNPELLAEGAARFDLPNIKTLLSWRHSATTTEDATEFHGLDPWVQWVGVHTGLPSREHGIRRLGDTGSWRTPPFWVELARRHDVTWGAWGVMNTPLVDATGCKFFFPDPWSFQERAHPEALNRLLELPRYISKNYMDLDRGQLLRGTWQLLRGLAGAGQGHRFLQTTLPQLIKRRNEHAVSTLFDYAGFCVFVDLCRRHHPDIRVIFLNAIAHLQHHVWHRTGEDWHPEMEFGLRMVDRMLGELIVSSGPEDAIVVMSALTQTNVAGEDIHIYRQINPTSVLDWLGCRYEAIEPCMTHEAQVIFPTAGDADDAIGKLEQCALSDGTPAFAVERLARERVFYQIAFHHALAGDAELRAGERAIPVARVIDLHAVRTGSHVPRGDIFATGIDLPGELANHEVTAHLKRFVVDAGRGGV